jgi:hypothetical protein
VGMTAQPHRHCAWRRAPSGRRSHPRPAVAG